jgi:GTP-binding protein HflX
MSQAIPGQPEDRDSLFLVYVHEDDAETLICEAELEGLIEAAGGDIAGSARQKVKKPLRATYIGKGKVEEIKLAIAETGADACVFDCELSGIQLRNLEEAFECRVLDRTQLILDIFASRAFTREGQLQVELAMYTYRLPRLMSVYTKFERQRGGIGMRGPGETKLESDRRMVRDRISKLKGEIDQVKRHRDLQRAGRKNIASPTAAIVGYTSSGKSTLMNHMAGTSVLADAMPFATLDPTTRKVDQSDGFSFFLVDTVGFIRDLPTQLVAAFRATLEETINADILLHLVDVSNPDWEIQMDAVDETLAGLGAQDVPDLILLNKVDIADPEFVAEAKRAFPDAIPISALNGDGIDDLLAAMKKKLSGRLKSLTVLVPYDKSQLVESAYGQGRIIRKDYREDGIYLEAELSDEHFNRLEAFACARED